MDYRISYQEAGFNPMVSADFSAANTNGYRYGFNLKEQDQEWNGGGNMYDYGFRIYDPMIAKFLSEDHLIAGYPMLTPYQFAGNTPIAFVDLDGLEAHPSDALNGADEGYRVILEIKDDRPINLHHPATRRWKYLVKFQKFNRWGKWKTIRTVKWSTHNMRKNRDVTMASAALTTAEPLDAVNLGVQLNGRPVPGSLSRLITSPGEEHTIVYEFSEYIVFVSDQMPVDGIDPVETESHGGYGKMFRHLLWQSLATHMFGENDAQSMGDYFEMGNRADGTENGGSMSYADLINNSYGRQFYKDFTSDESILNRDVSTEGGLLNYLNYISGKVTDIYNERNGTNICPYVFTNESEGFDRLLDAVNEELR